MHTKVDKNIGCAVEGYVVNASLGEKTTHQIGLVQDALTDVLGDIVWCQPREALHITLMDWIAPLVKYSVPKLDLFQILYPRYNTVLENVLAEYSPINIQPMKLTASSKAVFVQFDDAGNFNAIREEFLSRVTLAENTKPPSKITHTTIARFTGKILVSDVEDILSDCALDQQSVVDEFRLMHEIRTPLLEAKEIKSYLL